MAGLFQNPEKNKRPHVHQGKGTRCPVVCAQKSIFISKVSCKHGADFTSGAAGLAGTPGRGLRENAVTMPELWLRS